MAQPLKIYTRKGDKGSTALFGGKSVSKYDVRVEAFGTVDELNSIIGVAIAEMHRKRKFLAIRKELEKLPHDLYDIGALLATPQDTKIQKAQALNKTLPSDLKERVEEFEKYIDELTEKLSLLQSFIAPVGGKVGSLLHYARTICRRAERRIVELSHKEKVHPEILVYMNRLSDVLFTAARFANYKEKRKEIIWNKHKKFK